MMEGISFRNAGENLSFRSITRGHGVGASLEPKSLSKTFAIVRYSASGCSLRFLRKYSGMILFESGQPLKLRRDSFFLGQSPRYLSGTGFRCINRIGPESLNCSVISGAGTTRESRRGLKKSGCTSNQIERRD